MEFIRTQSETEKPFQIDYCLIEGDGNHPKALADWRINMTQKSMLEKVRVRRPRPPEPTPKEREAWQAFMKMAKELQGEGQALNPLVASELDRLAAKGNPLAIRLKERLSAAAFKPREADEQPKAPPVPRRISALKWGGPDSKKHAQGGEG